MQRDRAENPDFEFCPVLAELVRFGKVIGKSGKFFNQLAPRRLAETIFVHRAS